MSVLAYTLDQGDRLEVVNANTAQRNALSPEYCAVLTDALARAADDPAITSVILRAEDGFFCSGGDLTMLAGRRDLSRAGRLDAIEALHDVIRAIIACPKPVIAAVEGGAAGAGVSLAFACDMVVAARDAAFSVAYVRVGLVPDGGLTATLGRNLSQAMLMRMALSGDPVGAERLFALGALTDLAEPGAALATAQALANRLATGPTATQGTIKALINARDATLTAQMMREREAMADALASPEAAEGIGAFLDKRRPDFAACRKRHDG